MPVERAQLLETYRNAHAMLVAALPQFPPAIWQWRPDPGSWSIHEIMLHIADSEANSFVRCRRCIAEPGAAVMSYDQDRWATQMRYHEQATEDALELFKWLRLQSYNLIRSLPEATWAQTISHPENGTMTLDDWLVIYARHIPDHIEQMQANYAAWKSQQNADAVAENALISGVKS